LEANKTLSGIRQEVESDELTQRLQIELNNLMSENRDFKMQLDSRRLRHDQYEAKKLEKLKQID
jgi:hypothetical protein